MSAFIPRSLSLVSALCFFLLLVPWAATHAITQPIPGHVAESYGKLPLSFEANQGQTTDPVKFFARGPGYSLFLTADEAVLALRKSEPRSARLPNQPSARAVPPKDSDTSGAVLRMRLAGAREPTHIVGRDRQSGTVNYFKGRDPGQWRTGVATYGKVEYQGVYPGVDLVYYGSQRQLEYDFVVAPGADPGAIRLSFAENGEAGERAVVPQVAGNGDLLLPTGVGEVRLHKPVVYQDIGGQRREIDGRFVVLPEGKGELRVGFQLAEYDRGRALVIDPVLVYSTYLGGSGNDWGSDIAVDREGNAYVTGWTSSANFPSFDGGRAYSGGACGDAFVTKLSADGKKVVYSTYLGGSGCDRGQGIDLDGSRNVYVTGGTQSVDFPIVNAKYSRLSGGDDAFVVKLGEDGKTIIYSTYLGGNGDESSAGIAVNDSDDVVVTGVTNSANFPVINAKYPNFGGGVDYNSYGRPFNDAFVAKFSSNGQVVSSRTQRIWHKLVTFWPPCPA